MIYLFKIDSYLIMFKIKVKTPTTKNLNLNQSEFVLFYINYSNYSYNCFRTALSCIVFLRTILKFLIQNILGKLASYKILLIYNPKTFKVIERKKF